MLQRLLDEHLSPEVAEGLRRSADQLSVWSLPEWENGRFLGQPDDLLLTTAFKQRLTLVTYDRKTIPPLLKCRAESSQDHGGVIFVDDKTMPAADFGGLILALERLTRETESWDWTNRICFLRR